MAKDSAKTLLSQNYSFMQEYLSHCIMVPELLLKDYKLLGLSDEEFINLLRILKLNNKFGSFTLKDIQEEFSLEYTEAQGLLDVFFAKALISPLANTDGEEAYNLDALFGELFEAWYFNKNCSRGKKTGANSKRYKNSQEEKYKAQLSQIYQSFEKEIGRGLSPLEGEKLIQWLVKDGIAPELILEALRRAVMQGKISFSYIDRIILSWQKQNLRSLIEVNAKDTYPQINPKGRKQNQAPVKSEYNTVYNRIIKS